MNSKIKLGVIGDPIDHSLSPLIHSQFSEALDFEIDYQPFNVTDTELDNFIKKFFAEGGLGLNVTLPHKLNCIRSAHILSNEVKILGAANTLSQNNDNEIIANSTDGLGFMKDCADKNIEIQNKTVLILGAGGASQSIIPAIARMNPAKLMIDNRSSENVKKLVDKFSDFDAQAYENDASNIDLLINATSLGLSGSFDWDISNGLDQNTIFYDLNYGNATIEFFKWANQFSSNRFDGTGMLIAQAAYSFELWFDKFPDTSKINLSAINV